MARKGEKLSKETKRKISLANKGKKKPSLIGNTNGFKKGQKSYMKGRNHSEESKNKMSKSRKGVPSPLKGRKRGLVPKSVFKKKCTPWNKGIKYEAITGENHWNWKGGIHYRHRNHDWKLIRQEVLINYDFKCLHCGREENIQVHHKIPYSEVKEHKFDNLIPLCPSCHMKEEWKYRSGD